MGIKIKPTGKTCRFRLLIKPPDRNRVKLFEDFKETFSRKSFFNGFQGNALTYNTRKKRPKSGVF